MSQRTLLTGFGPFLSITDNPSAQLARALGLPHHVIEVSYSAAEQFVAQLDPNSFDRLLLMGVADGRSHLCPEMLARNTYGSAEDVTGQKRTGQIEVGGSEVLASTLFDESLLAKLAAVTPDFLRSEDAGTYLCNFIYYKALSAFPAKRIGFLHIPTFDTVSFDNQLRLATELLRVIESGS